MGEEGSLRIKVQRRPDRETRITKGGREREKKKTPLRKIKKKKSL